MPGINDAVKISRGSQVCTSLHNGMTPQQIIDANPIVYFDLRGVIDAAQHELCPDTFGQGRTNSLACEMLDAWSITAATT